MENLHIEGSDSLPAVEFNNSGLIKLSGRALPENAFEFFNPLIQWVREFSCEELNIEINLEYFNTAVSKQLHDLLKTIENNQNYQKINLYLKDLFLSFVKQEKFTKSSFPALSLPITDLLRFSKAINSTSSEATITTHQFLPQV